jgi:hypothetical protein
VYSLYPDGFVGLAIGICAVYLIMCSGLMEDHLCVLSYETEILKLSPDV